MEFEARGIYERETAKYLNIKYNITNDVILIKSTKSFLENSIKAISRLPFLPNR